MTPIRELTEMELDYVCGGHTRPSGGDNNAFLIIMNQKQIKSSGTQVQVGQNQGGFFVL